MAACAPAVESGSIGENVRQYFGPDEECSVVRPGIAVEEVEEDFVLQLAWQCEKGHFDGVFWVRSEREGRETQGEGGTNDPVCRWRYALHPVRGLWDKTEGVVGWPSGWRQVEGPVVSVVKPAVSGDCNAVGGDVTSGLLWFSSL
jgi:hypothetical protein